MKQLVSFLLLITSINQLNLNAVPNQDLNTPEFTGDWIELSAKENIEFDSLFGSDQEIDMDQIGLWSFNKATDLYDLFLTYKRQMYYYPDYATTRRHVHPFGVPLANVNQYNAIEYALTNNGFSYAQRQFFIETTFVQDFCKQWKDTIYISDEASLKNIYFKSLLPECLKEYETQLRKDITKANGSFLAPYQFKFELKNNPMYVCSSIGFTYSPKWSRLIDLTYNGRRFQTLENFEKRGGSFFIDIQEDIYKYSIQEKDKIDKKKSQFSVNQRDSWFHQFQYGNQFFHKLYAAKDKHEHLFQNDQHKSAIHMLCEQVDSTKLKPQVQGHQSNKMFYAKRYGFESITT